MPLPTPPFTYNDSRLVYNEHCFFYNGGYNDICLNPPTESVVRRGGRSTFQKYTYPKRVDTLDVLFSTYLSGVNTSSFEQEKRYLRFRDVLEPDPNIQVFSLRTSSSKPKQPVDEIMVTASPLSFSKGSRNELNEDFSISVGSQIFIKSQPQQNQVNEAVLISQNPFDSSGVKVSVNASLINPDKSGSFK